MQVKDTAIGKLIPYANNPRHNENAIDAVAASIREFGFKVPIIVDGDGVIVAGHTRLLAAEKLGLAKVPVIIADDLTPEQVQAFRIADNKTAELADWDFTALEAELAAVSDSFDMSEFGFADGDIDLSDISDNSDREPNDRSITATCPECGHEFEV
jgi:site-specific DNA-methyltransferase (adenine-specific)